MNDNESEDEALSNLVAYFAERLNLVFAYFYCVVEFEHDEELTVKPSESGRAWGLQTIRAACLHTTLIALRDLDDVLSPRTDRSKPDDLKISDFGYPTGLSFLTATERRRINKEIAHSTLPGATRHLSPWDMFELATKGIRQSVQFFEWVERKFAAEHFLTWSAALVCRTRTQKIHDYFAGRIAKRRPTRAPANATGNA